MVCGGVTNSFFNFNGGTLTTSNNNGLASSILLASNTSWTINGNWTQNGGTNLISNVATNSNPTAAVYVGNGTNNVQINVNSNAVWWLAIPTNSFATNTLELVIGNGNATNNLVIINNGTLIVTNAYGLNGGTDVPIIVGNSAGSAGNQLIITNGGQVFASGATVGRSSFNNLLVVGGMDAGGNKATMTFNSGVNLTVGGSGNPGTNNTVRVDSGGLIMNVNSIYIGGSSTTSDSNCVANALIITNGGQVFGSGTGVIGLLNGCKSNSATIGGGTGISLWNLGNHSLTIGNNANASNNYSI